MPVRAFLALELKSEYSGVGMGVPVQTSLITDGRFAEMLSASVVYSARFISLAISSEEMLPVKSVCTSRHPIAHSTWPSNAVNYRVGRILRVAVDQSSDLY